jgi:hypothetical protein
MPLIFTGFVLLLLIAVFAPYVIAIAAVLIMKDREAVAFFVSLVPLGFLIASLTAVYLGFQDIRREFKKPRRHLGSEDAD